MPRKTFGPQGLRGAMSGFNEAAARCRGKPLAAFLSFTCPPPSFNEAAARCRGKPSRRIGGGKAPARLQ